MALGMAQWDVVVVGGANMDYLVRGERLPLPGETVQGEVFDEAPGGKGANQAVGCSRLGARVALVARLGADERGDVIFQRLVAEGVEVRYVRSDPEAGTGIALVMVDGTGEKAITAVPRANARVGHEDLEQAAAALRSSRVLLLQLEGPLDVVAEAVRIAKESGARVVLDPSPARPLPQSLLAQVDVIRPNAQEAQVLTGVAVDGFDSARKAAEVLLARGVGAAVVGAGRDGDLLLSPDGERRLPRFAVESVDATGAGDAFAAGLATALAWDLPTADAAVIGSAAAAIKTTRLGAQAGLATLKELQVFLSQQGIRLPVAASLAAR
jgi:ribokinase